MSIYSLVVSKAIKMRPIVSDPKDLMELSSGIREIEKQLGADRKSVFANKYIMHPVGSSVVIIAAVSVIVALYCVLKNKGEVPQAVA